MTGVEIISIIVVNDILLRSIKVNHLSFKQVWWLHTLNLYFREKLLKKKVKDQEERKGGG